MTEINNHVQKNYNKTIAPLLTSLNLTNDDSDRLEWSLLNHIVLASTKAPVKTACILKFNKKYRENLIFKSLLTELWCQLD